MMQVFFGLFRFLFSILSPQYLLQKIFLQAKVNLNPFCLKMKDNCLHSKE